MKATLPKITTPPLINTRRWITGLYKEYFAAGIPTVVMRHKKTPPNKRSAGFLFAQSSV